VDRKERGKGRGQRWGVLGFYLSEV
jgi:hypothetical protein